MRAHGDDQVPRPGAARCLARSRDANSPGTGDPGGALRYLGPGLLEPLDMPAVVGRLAVLAAGYPVAEVGRAAPRVIAAQRVDPGRVQQRLRRHARPERARSTDELAFDNQHAGAQATGFVPRGFARCT